MLEGPTETLVSQKSIPGEPGIDKGSSNCFGIVFGDSAGSYGAVPGLLDLLLHPVDSASRLFRPEKKSRVLRQNIAFIRKSTLIPALHCEVTVILADDRQWRRCQPSELNAALSVFSGAYRPRAVRRCVASAEIAGSTPASRCMILIQQYVFAGVAI